MFKVTESPIKPIVAAPATASSHAPSLATLQPSSARVSDEEVLLCLVRDAIEKSGRSIEFPYFKAASLQLLECAPALWRIEGTSNIVGAVKSIFEFAATTPERSRLVSNTLPHLLRGRSSLDKRALIDVALALPSKSLRKSMAFGVLRSGSSRADLELILTESRKRKLVALKSKPLTEIVAKVEVLRVLRDVPLVPAMWDRKFLHNNPENRKTARQRVRALGEAARKGMHELSQLDYLCHPARASSAEQPKAPLLARPLRDAMVTLSAIKNSVEKMTGGPRQSYGRLREFINTNARRLTMECREGVRLLQSHTLPDKDLWTPKRVQALLDALHMVPEGDRLMTPNLREFIVTDLKHYGERRYSGRIALSAGLTLAGRQISLYGGNRTITWVTIHEVAHSLQMGLDGAFVRWDPATGEQLAPNHPLVNFRAFMALSGWRVLGCCAHKDLVDRNAVTVGGGVYPLDRPVLVPVSHLSGSRDASGERRWVIFRRNGSFLYCHDATAQFTLDRDACKDPGEDWAETFCEYRLCPDRLIQSAPEKFHYMELHFQVYRASKDFSRITAAYRELRALESLRSSARAAAGAPRNEGGMVGEDRQQLFDFSRGA